MVPGDRPGGCGSGQSDGQTDREGLAVRADNLIAGPKFPAGLFDPPADVALYGFQVRSKQISPVPVRST